MATKTRTADPSPVDLAEAYAQARDELAAIRRQGGADEPVVERVEQELEDRIVEFRRLHPSRLEAAQRKVRDAEQALHDASGPAAVMLADAKAAHREAQAAVARAEQAGATGKASGNLADLIGAEEVAARRVAAMEPIAARKAQAYAQRLALDTTHADTLAQASTDLEAARQALAEKAAAAEQALFALVAAADAYGEQHRTVTGQLAGLGFTGDPRHDGSPHDTTAGPTLRVNGRAWPHVEAALLLPRAVARVAYASSDRSLYDAMRRQTGHRPYEADALLADVPEPVTVARRRPQRPQAVRAETDLQPPVLADRSNYIRTEAKKPRFGPFGQRTA